MALDATIGGAASNSFLSLLRAKELLADRLYVDEWNALGQSGQSKALIMATDRIVGVTCWTGQPATTTQALPWPRIGMTGRNGGAVPSDVIPLEIELATARMAARIAASDITADNDAATQGLSRVKAGPVEVEWKDEISTRQGHPIDPDQWDSVLPNDVLAYIPPSWLCPKPANRFFQVLG